MKREPPRPPADVVADAARAGSLGTLEAVAEELRSTATVSFRLHPARRDTYRDAAEREDKTLTDWIVATLDAEIARKFVDQAFPANKKPK